MNLYNNNYNLFIKYTSRIILKVIFKNSYALIIIISYNSKLIYLFIKIYKKYKMK